MPQFRSRARAMCLSLVLAAALVALLPSSGQTVPGGTVQVFTPQADTYASSSTRSKTHGSLTYMRVDGSPRVGYVRFSVSGVSGSVTRTSLRVYSTRSYSPGFQVRSVANNAWDEGTLKWNNRPEVSSAVTASSGPVAARSWVSLDVSSVVQGNGTYSFGLTGTGSGSTYLLLATKEAGSATAPQLVVEDSGVPDTTPPSTPTDLRPLSATASSVTLGWTAATDAVGVTAYGIYRDGSFVGTTAETSYMLGGLACGRSYSLSVDARDAAGNRSPQASLTIATGSCDDTQPPSAPTALVTRATTETSISLGWNPSTDDVGVAGYNLYVEGGGFGSTQATAHTFGGLSCGRTYTLGVEAYDAAGNLSPRATLAAGTSYCSTPATSYYVDTAGNDGNTGTSPGAAWRTLARASTAALVPGDTLLLKRGGSWTESLRVSRSGSAGAPIRIAAYGTGDSPRVGGVGNCIVLSGSYLVVRELHPDDCSWAGVEVRGSNNLVEANLITRNAAGVDIKAGALDNAILQNRIENNNKMSVLTPTPSTDDSGAFGVAVHGDRTEIAFNTISGSDAFSYDFGRDGSAIEVYGGRQSNVHHNLAVDNHDFSELGNSRSADNMFAYNVVRSSLETSIFLITRGANSGFGPVLRTRVYNNTVALTGRLSQGFVCHAGCNADVLTMRGNVIQAVWKAGYADAPFDEDDDLFYGGIRQFTMGPGSVVADPRFVDPGAGNLHLRSSSPAIDGGTEVGQTSDFDEMPVPVDGNGDGHARPDMGGFEYRPTADSTPPSEPGSLAVTGTTAASISLSWTAASDNVRVAGYGLYSSGALLGTTVATSHTFPGLACETSYTFAVDAYDAAGNRSQSVSLTAATSPCPDTTPPSSPLNPLLTVNDETSITLVWGASIDNVGVAGYGLYRGGIRVGTSALPTGVVTGLSCGTSYSLGVDAYDAAGNRSPQVPLTASTMACGDRQPPTVSVSRPAAGATVSGAVTLAANASDNVGVTQAKWFVDGVEVAWDGTGSPWEQNWNSTSVPDGAHQIFARAADAAGNWGTSPSISFGVSNATPPPPPGGHTIAAVGDFTSCQGTGCSSGNSKAVHDVIVGMNPEILLGVGDFQYENISTILNGWDRLYGPKPAGGLFPITRPTAGPTHDVTSCTDSLYESYFGRSAMRPYSFNVGSWHIISLPSAAYRYGCDTAGVLAALNADLNANTQPCTLAFFQDPYWTRPTARHTRLSALRPWIQALYDHNAELVVQGSNHDYQRFAPQNPSDGLDPARGLRAFVVGTGGIGLYPFTGTAPNVEASDDTTFGALKLVLHANSYDFQFVRAAGGSFTDSGTGACH